MSEKPRYVQTRHPVTKQWIRIDTFMGSIVGKRKKKYPIPVAKKKNE